MDNNIDIVVPWVNDADPIWLKKKEKFISNKLAEGELTSKNRFFDYGTLKYVLRSIERNMPWIHQVFLLTDQQCPNWINLNHVHLIDHKAFINGRLPTFNSNAIMTSIGNIPGLSDKFIVFNDEFIVWQKTKVSDFFKNNLPVDSLIEIGTVPFKDGFFHISQNDVALINATFSKHKIMKKRWNKFFNYKYGIQNLRTILSLPYKAFLGFQNQHLAIPYTKNDFKIAYKKFPESFKTTWDHQFRQLDDINEWLVRYLRNLNGNFVPGYLNGQFFTLSDFKERIPTVKHKSKMVVINDDGCYSSNVFEHLNVFLEDQFAEKSKYEK